MILRALVSCCSNMLNIAAYKFVPLSDLDSLREDLLRRAVREHLKGTILLAPEGINLFLAGESESIEKFLDHLRSLAPFTDLRTKNSHSPTQPFRRLRVRIKAHIIPFPVPAVDPARHTSPRISPEQLKQWLDEHRPLTLLDTRNNFEVAIGTFDNAMAIDIPDFNHFPEAAQKLPESLKSNPVVTFCTGGIRCEKAAPYLESLGFQNVLQLDGGILNYLEVCGHAHFRGDCFVFDQRLALDDSLAPSENPPDMHV